MRTGSDGFAAGLFLRLEQHADLWAEIRDGIVVMVSQLITDGPLSPLLTVKASTE